MSSDSFEGALQKTLGRARGKGKEKRLEDGASAAEPTETTADERMIIDEFDAMDRAHYGKQYANMKDIVTSTGKIYTLQAMLVILRNRQNLGKVQEDIHSRLVVEKQARAIYEVTEQKFDEDFDREIGSFLIRHNHTLQFLEQDGIGTHQVHDLSKNHTKHKRQKRHGEAHDYMQGQGKQECKEALLKFCKGLKITPPTDKAMDQLFHAISSVPRESHASASQPGHPSHLGGSGSAGGGSSSQHASHHPHPHPGHGKQGGPSG